MTERTKSLQTVMIGWLATCPRAATTSSSYGKPTVFSRQFRIPVAYGHGTSYRFAWSATMTPSPSL